MRKLAGLILIAATLALAASAHAGTPAPASTPGFTLCKSTYALCTTARCKPIPGQPGNLLCGCSVETGYSAGTHTCKPVRHTNAGDLIYSRYYPVKAYAVCSNARPWAWCLDVPCLVDKKNPARASCTCTVAKNQTPYVIVGSGYDSSTCTTGIVSSATVQGITQIDAFIRSQHLLPNFTVKVVNTPAPKP